MHEVKVLEVPLPEIFGESAVEVTFWGFEGAFVVAFKFFENLPSEVFIVKAQDYRWSGEINSFDQVDLSKFVQSVVSVPYVVIVDQVEWIVSSKILFFFNVRFSVSVEELVIKV